MSVASTTAPVKALHDLSDDDFNEAARFLERLSETPNASPRFVFQTFDDSPEKRGALAHVLPGTLHDVWPTLQRFQRDGAGVFVTVNETAAGGRKEKDVTGVRAVWRDVDKGTPADLPLEEHIRVTTPAGFHSYLLTNAGPSRFNEWKAVMATMVSTYGADRNAKDLARVLRLPGTWHLKDPANPFKVKIDRISNRERYSWSEIVEAIPLACAAPLSVAPSGDSGNAGASADAELVRAMMTGENWHEPALSLSARHVAKGMAGPALLELLRGLMLAADDGSARFKSRFAELPRIAASAVQKFGPGRKHAEILDMIEAAEIADRDSLAMVDTVLGAVAANPALKSAEIDDLLQRLKRSSGIGIKALRDDLRSRNDGADGSGGTHADYALQLLQSLVDASGKHQAVGVEGQLYALSDDGVWRGREASQFEVEVGRRFSGLKNCQRRGDYISIAGHAYAIAAQERADFFDGAPVGLACPTGFCWLDGAGDINFEKLDASHRQRFVIGESPDPCSSTPLFDTLLAQSFAASTPTETQEQVDLLQEVMGAVVMGLMARHEKVALFYGAGRSGKGTVLKIIERMVPEHWRAAQSPFSWDQEYYLAALAGKRLNLVGELPDDVPIPAAQFKTVTGHCCPVKSRTKSTA